MSPGQRFRLISLRFLFLIYFANNPFPGSSHSSASTTPARTLSSTLKISAYIPPISPLFLGCVLSRCIFEVRRCFFFILSVRGVRILLHVLVLWYCGTRLGVFSSPTVPYGLIPRVGPTGSSPFLLVDVGVEDDSADVIRLRRGREMVCDWY